MNYGIQIKEHLGKNFADILARREIIKEYQNANTTFSGNNENGEKVELHVSENGIILKTYQENGYVRVNYYNAEEFEEGESFEGRWK